MSFFGKASKKLKKFKHNVLDKGSLSHNAAQLVLGKKKGSAVFDQIDVGVGNAFTFGLGKPLAEHAQAAEAQDDFKKATKKAEILAIKKGVQFFLPAATAPNATAQIVSTQSPSSGGFFGGLEQGLGSINSSLDDFVDSGREVLNGPEQDELLAAKGSNTGNPLMFLAIGGGLLMLVALTKR